MSVSDREISDSKGGSFGVGDGDDEDEDETSCSGFDDGAKMVRKGGRGWFRKDIRKAKAMFQQRFEKAKKQLSGRRNGKRVPSSSTSEIGYSSGTGKIKTIDGGGSGGGGGSKGCYFCFRGPFVMESPDGSQISDPNDPNFTYDMLKILIENNAFYSEECNPHLC